MSNLDNWLSIGYYLFGFISLIGIWIGLGLKPNKMRERIKINQELRLERYNKTWIQNTWMKRYHFLLDVSFRRYKLSYFSKVVVTQFLSFIFLTLLFYIAIQELRFALFASVLFIYLIPIGFMYMKHKQVQSAVQNEIIEVSVLLLQEYQKNHYHMLYALKEVTSRTKGKSQLAYARLFARMHDDDDMKKLSAEAFAFQLGRIRGKNLASIILRACKDGTIVTTMLEDLVEDVTEFNKRIRTGETEARETSWIGYFPLPALIFLILYNQKSFIPNGKAMEYQFQTATGLKSFTIAFVCSLIGIAMALILKNPKKE